VGTSYTDYGPIGFWAFDGHLELWLHLLVASVDAAPDPEPWLRAARDDWFEQATVGFVGHVCVDLDRHLAGDPDREASFRRLLREVDRRIASHGEAVPAEVTGRLTVGGGRTLGAVSTDLLHRFTAAMDGLVRGEAAWDTTHRVPGVWSAPA